MFWRIMGLLVAAARAAVRLMQRRGSEIRIALRRLRPGSNRHRTAGGTWQIDRIMLYSVSGDFDGPIWGLSPVSLFYPVSASALVNRAVASVRAGYYRDAIDDLDAALNFNPVAADAYYARGRIYGLTGSPRQALADLNEA